MYFEGRELKPYAEPVSGDELIHGNTYFVVSFIDAAMLIPTLQPVVYVGLNLESGDHETAYFQDVDSFNYGVTYETAADSSEASFLVAPLDRLSNIFEFEKALDVLLACFERRKCGARTP